MHFPFFTLMISALLCLAACTPKDKPKNDGEETTSTSVNDDKGPRRGLLTVDVKIAQAHNQTISKDNKTSFFSTHYDMTVHSEQEVNIARDFTYFLDPQGEPDSAERLAFFKSSPYWPIRDVKPELSGRLSYDGEYKHEHPNASSYVLLHNTNAGKASPTYLRIGDIGPSVLGNGMEFELEWGFEGTESTTAHSTTQSGFERTDTETDKEVRRKFEDMKFYPSLSDARLEAYPYAYHYRDTPELIPGLQKHHQTRLSSLQQLTGRDSEILYFADTVTHASKDEMTITYSSHGKLLNLNLLHSLPLKPNIKSAIEVRINIVAND